MVAWESNGRYKKKINKRKIEKSAVELLTATSRKPTRLEWFDLEKSRRIKAFRCEEFSDCIKTAESKQAQNPKGTLKYARREDAIRLALQLEEEMLKKIKKRKAGGEGQARTVHTKRSRSVYLPADTDCFSDDSQSNLAKCRTSVKATSSYGPNTTQVVDTHMATLPSQLNKNGEEAKNTKAEQNPRSNIFLGSPPCDIVAAKHLADEENIKRKQKKLSNAQNRQEPVLSVESRCSDELVFESVNHHTAAKHLTREVKRKGNQKTSSVSSDLVPVISGKSFSTIRNGTHYSGDAWDLSKVNPKTMEKSLDTMDARLIDAEVTVEESSGAKHVPLVALMSRFNGKAIIGYPVNIERSSEYRLHKHESRPLTFLNDQGITSSLKLTWKKRRTPVSYALQPQSSPMPNNIKKAKNHQSGVPTVVSCVPLAKIFSGLFLALGKV